MSETDAPWNDDGDDRPSEFVDGFQSHSVYEGTAPATSSATTASRGDHGFGIGLYPRSTTSSPATTSAPGEGQGLVGDNSQPVACT